METAFAADNVKIGLNTGPLDALLSAGLVVQLTLLLLVALSVFSWGIILTKRKQLLAVKKQNQDFLDLFWSAPSLDGIYSKLGEFAESPIAQVFKAGFIELQRLAEASGEKQDDVQPSKLMGHDNLARALRKASDKENQKIESRLTFLASTSSLAPFVGLFGTVWGIMSAFHMVGRTGSASLAVVAPGISEALIATAIGLATALPAGAAYNYFLSLARNEEIEISNFTADFLNISKRNFFKGE